MEMRDNFENLYIDRRHFERTNRLNSHDRYHRDPLFRRLVDTLQMMLEVENSCYTPTELREAVMLAAEKYEYL
jgi:hypothetical protein